MAYSRLNDGSRRGVNRRNLLTRDETPWKAPVWQEVPAANGRPNQQAQQRTRTQIHLMAIARTIHHATTQRGILHRDLKPPMSSWMHDAGRT